jgi:hypothetical protein
MFSDHGGCYRGGMSEERAPAWRLRDLNPVVADGLYGVVYGIPFERWYDDVTWQDWVTSYALLAAAWGLGELQRRRHLATAHLEQLNAQLQRERDLKARWAVAEERARIARELHDVVAHSVSVMVVQAGAARRLVDGDPAQARQALTSIESTGRQALAEMRRLVGVMRHDGEARPEEAADALAPQPGLADLDALVSRARDAGLEVEVQVEGAPRPLAAGVDLSAYRIVQEALTNCLKHAGAAKAIVHLCYGREDLELQVLDDGAVDHQAVARPVLVQPARPGQPRPATGIRHPDRARAGGVPPAGARPVQRGDRRGAGGERDHRQDARGQGADEAGPARPGPGGGARLRDRDRPTSLGLTRAQRGLSVGGRADSGGRSARP